MTYQGGYAGTTGIIHTGIGPFDIQSGSKILYGKLQYTKSALQIGAFGNFVDVPNAPNVLQRDPSGKPVVLGFKTQTYDFEVGNSNVVAERHILSYGGNARRNNFDITLAPNSKDRNEFGAYFQEEYFVDKFRLAAGVRVDKFGNLDSAFWSPRVSLMFKPTPDHSLRISFNPAFPSPSDINHYLAPHILAPPPPHGGAPHPAAHRAAGGPHGDPGHNTRPVRGAKISAEESRHVFEPGPHPPARGGSIRGAPVHPRGERLRQLLVSGQAEATN